MNQTERENIRHILDAELTHVHTSDRQRRTLLENAKGEKIMKKKSSLGLVLTIVCILTACVALASSGAFEALKAMWEDSFRRMNTTALIEAMDESEIPGYLQQFEAEYGGKKEDLILSTVPGEEDLNLEDAVRIAKDAIMKKYGTPLAELDAMGIYPSFYKTPYQDDTSRWQVYVSPRTDVNLDYDHDNPAPGEYLAEIASPSGEVNECFFYNDDFWPDYALRCWENGSKDYVYEQAHRSDFLKQSLDNRKQFMNLFEEAGYDITPLQKAQSDERRLRAMAIDICFADNKEDLLESSDRFVLTAIQEMESRFGLSKEDMVKCHFVAIRSPQTSETVDICFSYNFNREAEANLGRCEALGAGYGTRLGYFMICMDAETVKVTNAINIIWDETLQPSYQEGLLSHMLWTKDDLPEYYRMMNELQALDAGFVAGRDSESALLNEADRVLLRYGGDPTLYTAQQTDCGTETLDQFLYNHGMTEEEIINKGFTYLLAHTSYSEDKLKQAVFLVGTMFDDMENPEQNKIHPTLLVILDEGNGQGMRWYFQFDLDLNVIQFEETKGNING